MFLNKALHAVSNEMAKNNQQESKLYHDRLYIIVFQFNSTSNKLSIYLFKRSPINIESNIPEHWGIGLSENG